MSMQAPPNPKLKTPKTSRQISNLLRQMCEWQFCIFLPSVCYMVTRVIGFYSFVFLLYIKRRCHSLYRLMVITVEI